MIADLQLMTTSHLRQGHLSTRPPFRSPSYPACSALLVPAPVGIHTNNTSTSGSGRPVLLNPPLLWPLGVPPRSVLSQSTYVVITGRLPSGVDETYTTQAVFSQCCLEKQRQERK